MRTRTACREPVARLSSRFDRAVRELDKHLAICEQCMDTKDGGVCPEAAKLMYAIPRASGEDDAYPNG